MRKLIYLFLLTFLALGCTSENKPAEFDSNVLINGTEFKIKTASKSAVISANENTKLTKLVLDYTDSCIECAPAPYRRIILKITSGLSEEIEGTYNLASPLNESRYLTGGYYPNGYPILFYSGSVTISKQNKNRYKIEFNGVKAKFFLNNTSETEVEGYFEGDFMEVEYNVED